MDPIISLCVPCHNRLFDLMRTLPIMIEAVNRCPPAEIVLVNYADWNGLDAYARATLKTTDFQGGSALRYHRYLNRETYHMAHARNLTVQAANGEVIVILSADIAPTENLLPFIRKRLPLVDLFLFTERYKGVITINRKDFIAAGGYDERMEFYGPEDQDLHERLIRRGLAARSVPSSLIQVIKTPDAIKEQGYRLPLTKKQMATLGHLVLDENRKNNLLVANPGGWGSWA